MIEIDGIYTRTTRGSATARTQETGNLNVLAFEAAPDGGCVAPPSSGFVFSLLPLSLSPAWEG
jgi:hypothetical protein